MDKVKRMVEAGVSIPTAVKESLGMTVADFAEKYGLSRASVANHVNGVVRAADTTVEALAAELGGTPDEWRELLWLAAKPESASA
jgi:plasmid maintenance system antidote protein VapI